MSRCKPQHNPVASQLLWSQLGRMVSTWSSFTTTLQEMVFRSEWTERCITPSPCVFQCNGITTSCHIYLNVVCMVLLGAKKMYSNSKTISNTQKKSVWQEEFWTVHEPAHGDLSYPSWVWTRMHLCVSNCWSTIRVFVKNMFALVKGWNMRVCFLALSCGRGGISCGVAQLEVR